MSYITFENEYDLDTPIEKITETSEIIENLIFIRNHIEKFGVTKELLNLVDLKDILNITTESDEEDEDLYSNKELAISKVAGYLKKAISFLVKLFLGLIDGIKLFFKFLFNETEDLRRSSINAFNYLEKIKKFESSSKYDEITITQHPLENLLTSCDEIISALDVLSNSQPDINKPFFLKSDHDLETLNLGIRYIGKEISEDKLISNDSFLKELGRSKKPKSLRELGFTPSHMLQNSNRITNYFKKLKSYEKFESILKKEKKEAIKELKNQVEHTKQAKKGYIEKLSQTSTQLVKLFESLCKTILKLIRFYCDICIKLPKSE